MYKHLVNSGINYQPQLVSRISFINRIIDKNSWCWYSVWMTVSFLEWLLQPWCFTGLLGCFLQNFDSKQPIWGTVDGIWPTSWGWLFLPLFTRLYTSQVVSRISSIHRSTTISGFSKRHMQRNVLLFSFSLDAMNDRSSQLGATRFSTTMKFLQRCLQPHCCEWWFPNNADH